MSHDLSVLFAAGVAYLAILFLVAYIADNGGLPDRLVNHPAIYILSLGVYATSWSYYGSVGFARESGYQFLTIYLGVTVAFLLSPVLLKPILRLIREYQLISLADLFAFRYRSQLAGALVTLFMLFGTLPYIALQIRAVTESLQVLTQEAAPQVLALGFCVTLILFAILFGARHISPREKHRGLVVAIAFESVIKLVALLSVGLFATYGVFDGPSGLSEWLRQHPEAVTQLYAPVHDGPWLTLLFLAFCAAFLLPRQFHMAFTENLNPKSLDVASWGFPLFLLLLNLAIPPILWAGTFLELETEPDYYILGIALAKGPDWMPVLSFVGGVSAASAMVIVTTLALSSMCLNHLLLPASYPDPRVDLYRWLLWGRRMLIAVIIMAGFGFYELLEHNQGLVQLGLISFVAVAQFMPGIIGVLYWRRATRAGFLLGLLGGIAVWTLVVLVPLLENSGLLQSRIDVPYLRQLTDQSHWEFATFWSLALNTLLFVAVSLLTRQSAGEREAAQSCCGDTLAPLSGVVAAGSSQQFKQGLASIIGEETAEKEVSQALRDLEMSTEETHPTRLRQLRERIERNLSGLIGPQMAHIIINRQLTLDAHTKTALADSMRYVEGQLEDSRSKLKGLSADLDQLRRFQRRILMDLPLGVCAIDNDQQVVLWNTALARMSDVDANATLGQRIQILPKPWGELLAGFAHAVDEHIYHMQVDLNNRPHWFNLHKATIIDPAQGDQARGETGVVMLVEDLTNLETLEAELAHSDRLASIGRLAAGVAHEIGNPVTGIASLAQNLREETDPGVIEQSIKDILAQTKRISGIVHSLISFSHVGSVHKHLQDFPVRDVLEDAIKLVRLTHKGKQVECTTHCPDNLTLRGDQQRLSQVLVNLFTNACDASAPGSRVEALAFADKDYVQIEVLDQGEGIPEHVREYIFEPFFTTKNPGEGTGLGLPLVYKIIKDHGGTINVDSEAGVGTRIVIRLPRQGDVSTDQSANQSDRTS